MNKIDRILSWLAWKLPRRLAYWCAMRVGVNASSGAWSGVVVPSVTVLEALERWR